MGKYFIDIINKFFDKKPNIHFIGIGGIGMSGLAGICLSYGFKVTGSDISDNINIQNLIKSGAAITLCHSEKNIGDSDIVVFSSAVKPDNPELVYAIKTGRCVLERHKFLGVIFNCYEKSIAVSGCHGKTTVCGFLSHILIAADADPQILIGGNLNLIGGNYRSGKGCCLAEACEYKRNFLSLKPLIPVVLNIEDDHMDYFKDTGDLINAYDSFLANKKNGGLAVVNGDDCSCAKLQNIKGAVTFGLKDTNTCYAKDIRKYRGKYSFTLVYKGNPFRIKLGIYGRHNIYNALAAFCAAKALGVKDSVTVNAIGEYKGMRRRFENAGKLNGADIILDYAHHPKEIRAVLGSAREVYKGKITAVFQPHTYSRTKTLMNDFTACFESCDKLILLPVYSAREAYDASGSSAALYDNLKKHKTDVIYLDSFKQAEMYLRQNKSSAILLIGAGDVDKMADMLKE